MLTRLQMTLVTTNLAMCYYIFQCITDSYAAYFSAPMSLATRYPLLTISVWYLHLTASGHNACQPALPKTTRTSSIQEKGPEIPPSTLQLPVNRHRPPLCQYYRQYFMSARVGFMLQNVWTEIHLTPRLEFYPHYNQVQGQFPFNNSNQLLTCPATIYLSETEVERSGRQGQWTHHWFIMQSSHASFLLLSLVFPSHQPTQTDTTQPRSTEVHQGSWSTTQNKWLQQKVYSTSRSGSPSYSVILLSSHSVFGFWFWTHLKFSLQTSLPYLSY